MAVSAGRAVLPIVPQLSRDFSRQLLTQMAGPATKAAEKTGRESGHHFGKHFSGGVRAGIGPVRGVLRGFGPALAAAFGGGAIIAGIKSVTDEAREAAVVGKQTTAVLKATGGVARVSAQQVGDLATALSNKVGVDDEAIQSAENLLLTFKGVRNEAGKGNDVFNQASAAIVDMTAAMNGGTVTQEGLKASTIQVGKALNDPIKGITALTRVGVTFTEQQKKQIAAMVKAGDTAGAQKIILGELRSEFGGTAAASADAGQRLGVVWGNIKEQIGTALLPILNRAFVFLADKLPGALKTVGRWFSTAVLGVKALGAAFREGDVTSGGFVGVMERIGSVLGTVWDWLAKTASAIWRVLGPAFASIGRALAPATAAFVGGLLPGLRTLWDVIRTRLWPILKVLGIVIGVVLYGALRYVLPVILRLAGPILGFLIRNLGVTIGWVANVVRWIWLTIAAFLRWVTGTKTTANAVKVAFTAIKNAVLTAVGFILKALHGWMSMQFTVVASILHVMGKLPGPMGAPFRAAETAVRKAKGTIDTQMDKIQARIDQLRGKDVKVKVTGAWDPPKGFTTKTLIQMSSPGGRGGLATGGRIPGFGGGDVVPAMLEPGEAVVDKDRTRKYSWFFSSIGVPGFARGGLVGDVGRVGDVAVSAMGGLRDATARAMTRVMRDALINVMKQAVEAATAGFVSGVRAPSSANRSTVLRVFASMFGWSGAAQRAATDQLLMHESGYRNTAQNPTSTAYGMFQFLNSTWGSVGGHKTSDPYLQAVYGGRYIRSRYGSPVGAWGFWSRHHWYDQGGWLPPGLSLAYNGTGKPEPVGFDYDKLADALAKAQTGPGGRQPVQLVLRNGQVLADLVTYEQHRAGR